MGTDVKCGGELFRPWGKTIRHQQENTMRQKEREEMRIMRRGQSKMECFVFSQALKQATENRAENLSKIWLERDREERYVEGEM